MSGSGATQRHARQALTSRHGIAAVAERLYREWSPANTNCTYAPLQLVSFDSDILSDIQGTPDFAAAESKRRIQALSGIEPELAEI